MRGYGYKAVQEAISRLVIEEHHSRAAASGIALALARRNYFRRHPAGLLPPYLALSGMRRRADYTAEGRPLAMKTRATNPVRELSISKAERARILAHVNNVLSGQGAAVRRAAKLYTDFTGHEDIRLGKVRVPNMPKVMLTIGKIDGIMYSTVRDGVAEKYVHEFKASSRPLFCVSPDGKQLYMLGGAYDFTERGIVDRRTRKL